MRALVPIPITRFAWLAAVASALAIQSLRAQTPSAASSEMGGMVATSAGLLAINPPSDWPPVSGPCLANFAPAATGPLPSICVSSSPVEAPGHRGSLDSFIAADIAAFRRRFPGAKVTREDPIALPGYTQAATVYSFASGDPAPNAFERVAYIADYRRVWILTLSASSQSALEQALPAFHAFVGSYRGSIQFDGRK